MSRRFQFSLRTFLVVVTLACLVFGWKVERARERGRAVGALHKDGAVVSYDGRKYLPDGLELFWWDFKGVPLRLALPDAPTAEVASHVSKAYPVKELMIHGQLRHIEDSDLGPIGQIANVARMKIQGPKLSKAAVKSLRETLPGTEIVVLDSFGKPIQ